ncbi:MAG: leucine-rich repeat domain-containing protein [Pirellulales bacterium]
MNALRWDGVEVQTSCLHHKSFKAAPCQFLLPLTSENQGEMLTQLRCAGAFGNYSGLSISGIADLNFLREFPDLRYLELVNQKRVDTRPLECLSNLRGLFIETPGAGIDFSWFPELEIFMGDWHVDNCHLGHCDELRTVSLRQFKPRSNDLTDLAQITRLESLHLVKTEISSLNGVETLEDLRYLEIAYAPKLTSLDALADGNCGIREFGLESAKKVASYRPLASISCLRRLRLFACAPMPDLHWTSGMNRLDSFSFVETLVEDGDLSPLLELPRLRYVGTMDKKHYNYKFAKLNQLLEERARPRTGSETDT